MAHKIYTPTARAILAPRREPYWHPLGHGKAAGYRVLDKTNSMTDVPARGSWVARFIYEDSHGMRKQTLPAPGL